MHSRYLRSLSPVATPARGPTRASTRMTLSTSKAAQARATRRSGRLARAVLEAEMTSKFCQNLPAGIEICLIKICLSSDQNPRLTLSQARTSARLGMGPGVSWLRFAVPRGRNTVTVTVTSYISTCTRKGLSRADHRATSMRRCPNPRCPPSIPTHTGHAKSRLGRPAPCVR